MSPISEKYTDATGKQWNLLVSQYGSQFGCTVYGLPVGPYGWQVEDVSTLCATPEAAMNLGRSTLASLYAASGGDEVLNPDSSPQAPANEQVTDLGSDCPACGQLVFSDESSCDTCGRSTGDLDREREALTGDLDAVKPLPSAASFLNDNMDCVSCHDFQDMGLAIGMRAQVTDIGTKMVTVQTVSVYRNADHFQGYQAERKYMSFTADLVAALQEKMASLG
jgi:hypothetical protein